MLCDNMIDEEMIKEREELINSQKEHIENADKYYFDNEDKASISMSFISSLYKS